MMKSRYSVRPFAAAAVAGILFLELAVSSARADTHFYGTIESISRSNVVVKTTVHSTDHGKIDSSSNVDGGIRRGDWVSLEVEASGHVKYLKLEEHPTDHVGVVKEIKGNELFVRSGNSTENWNLKDTTLLEGVSKDDFRVGDEIAAKLYKNRNLAQIKIVKAK